MENQVVVGICFVFNSKSIMGYAMGDFHLFDPKLLHNVRRLPENLFC